jgi:hypothetical protein
LDKNAPFFAGELFLIREFSPENRNYASVIVMIVKRRILKMPFVNKRRSPNNYKHLKKTPSLYPLYRFRSSLVAVESGQPEIALAFRTEPYSGGAYDMALLEQTVEKCP